ncbi:HesA/MoeB/ThiF family protein [Micromonospora sp. NPDC048935]|uniref:HesA/MoeB/ThiF family protein n=1 Tax=Micromonospora sp. NPDC048935 TaxID=3364262 RepID=UPI0037241AD7
MTIVDDVDDPEVARGLDGDDYYARLVERNHGLVDDWLQRRIRATTLLIAGCGSIGGAAVQPLARMGYTRFTLADNGVYELNNLNRQHALVTDLGRNKAEVAARFVADINPHASVTHVTDGVTEANAAELVAGIDVIVDGVDVTTPSGLRAKVALHEAACAARARLITAWDMAGTLAVQHFDYRRVRRIFDGEIAVGDLDRLSVWEAIFRIAPRRHIPPEMYAELAGSLNDPDYHVPQLVEAATQFGSLATHLVTKLVAGEPVPRTVSVDVRQVSRTLPERWAGEARRRVAQLRFVRALPGATAWNGFAPRPLYALGKNLSPHALATEGNRRS